jgi:energy-converting hydrogenase B subunit D
VTPVLSAALAIVALGGAAVAFSRDPAHQVIAMSFEGLALAVLFVALEAPEVALSQLAVGAVLVPLMYLAAIARTTRRTR